MRSQVQVLHRPPPNLASIKVFRACPPEGIPTLDPEYSQSKRLRSREHYQLDRHDQESHSGRKAHLTAEAPARVQIDRELEAAGWFVQDANTVTKRLHLWRYFVGLNSVSIAEPGMGRIRLDPGTGKCFPRLLTGDPGSSDGPHSL